MKQDIIVNERVETELTTHDFYYDLPEELIAQTPMEKRDTSRLLVLDRASGALSHRHFYDIAEYIRPEDIRYYEDFVTSVKLATRVSADPLRILDAYLDACYAGAVTDLLEPDNGHALLPRIVDNTRFPEDFAMRVGSCDKQCGTCGYCASVYENASVLSEFLH